MDNSDVGSKTEVNAGWSAWPLKVNASVLLPPPGMAPKGKGRGHLHAAVRLPAKPGALHPL